MVLYMSGGVAWRSVAARPGPVLALLAGGSLTTSTRPRSAKLAGFIFRVNAHTDKQRTEEEEVQCRV
jgi:hypothetical protein